MARSVVRNPTPRCARCQHLLRWCVCEGLRTVECPLAIDVLMHHRESRRPSSTGHLINRIIPASGHHVYHHDRRPDRASIVRPGKTLWILHPLGEPLPADQAPGDLQILLLDGSWGEAADMKREVEGWGRRVSLPMTGRSRYWLRAQQGEGQFSTMEALLFLLAALGLKTEHDQLRLQLELHVFAGLCTRGNKTLIADFLSESPLREAMPDLLRRLQPQSPVEKRALQLRLAERLAAGTDVST
ncbi:MAG: DTW domain-containing protein [Verrucomicrobia bacterium]|nr:DTW domain-containing protein [Verrucomicrobiota bacterium]